MQDRKQLIRSELSRVDGVTPERGGAKHKKMAANPFLFYRGSAQLFYADLAAGTLQLPAAVTDLPLTAVMGDCHTSNFGLMTEEGAHGDRVIFAPNDFDDACMGHAGWDLLRYSVSLLLCADYCEGVSRGRYPHEDGLSGKAHITKEQAIAAIQNFLQAYHKTCRKAAKDDVLYQFALDQVDSDHVLSKLFAKAHARAADGKDFQLKSTLAKAVDLRQKPLQFIERPERFRRLAALESSRLRKAFAPYMSDSILDIVERLNAGTGSVNMKRYYVLVGPEQITCERDFALCHIVEVKQQRAAAALHYFPELSQINRLNPAHLTVACQRRMQRAPDLVLDELEWRKVHWLIRSRHHARVGVDPENIGLGKRAVKSGLSQYAKACGQVLALAHCRGDRRSNNFEQAVSSVLLEQIPAMIETSLAYAGQVQQDCAMLQQMLQAGAEKNN